MGGSVASDAEKLAKPTRALFTTNYPLAVHTHVLPPCCVLCCCCCCFCCCMLRVRARVVARLATDATPLLSPLWLLLLSWLYSCAPLWAGECVVAFHTLHAVFAVGVVRRSKPCTTNMPGRCTWCTHGAVYQPTHQRTRKSRHGFRNTPMAFKTLVINLMKLKSMNMSRVLAWNSKLSVHVFLQPRTLQPHSGKLSDDACAIRHCSGDVG